MREILFGLTLVVAAAAFPIGGYSQTTSNPAYIRRPGVTLEEAITIGKTYVERKKIDVSQYYLDYVRLNLNPRGDRGKFWEVRWERSEGAAKGDFIWLFIYMDKQVELIAAK